MGSKMMTHRNADANYFIIVRFMLNFARLSGASSTLVQFFLYPTAFPIFQSPVSGGIHVRSRNVSFCPGGCSLTRYLPGAVIVCNV